MSEQNAFKDSFLFAQWRSKIETANRNNIFCCCRECKYEWVDSSLECDCVKCGSKKVERIACWQFPDD